MSEAEKRDKTSCCTHVRDDTALHTIRKIILDHPFCSLARHPPTHK